MRRQGWEWRLAKALEAARAQPYALGSHDCFRLVCAAVEALTGVDRWPEFAGQYATPAEALQLVARHGSTFRAAFDWFFGEPSIDVRLARRGDVVALRGEDGQYHLGVCLGAEVAYTAPKGLVFVPLLNGAWAWRVG